MKIGIVTTFSDKGYREYAKEFLETIKQYLDNQIQVFLYVDSVDIDVRKFDNIKVLNLEASMPRTYRF